MANHPVLDAANRYKAQLEANNAQALKRLIDAYRRAFNRLESDLEALLLKIGTRIPTKGELLRTKRFRALMRHILEELQSLNALTANEIEAAVEWGLAKGTNDGKNLISYGATGTNTVSATFNSLPTDTIKQLIGMFDPDGPLFGRLSELPPEVAKWVSDSIIEGVTLGYNPRRIAQMVRRAFGRGLSDALRFVRTAQIWSYREANRATYLTNSEWVEGWYWNASLDTRTCSSCVALHGTFHRLTKTLNDHHNGRCAPIPAVRGFPNPITESGEQWFGKQNKATQLAIMGPGKLEAWEKALFKFEQLTTSYDDAIYGLMLRETALKDLVPVQ